MLDFVNLQEWTPH